MAHKKKTWQEKLHDNKGHPTVAPVTGKLSKRWGAGTMVIPAPIEVDDIMKKVRKGKRLLVDDFEKHLVKP